MIDKFLFIDDLKGSNGKIAQENAFKLLEDILDEEIECEMCDDKDFEIVMSKVLGLGLKSWNLKKRC
jgi:hypothetical protein